VLPFCHLQFQALRPVPPAYPRELRTLGDQLGRHWLDLNLCHREVADRLGADHSTITNWELNRTKPALHFLPGILRYLGYAPWAAGASVGDRLLAYRRDRGLAQAAFARLLGIDPSTLSRWERDLRVPTGRYAQLAKAFVERSARQGPALNDLLPSNCPADVQYSVRRFPVANP
jgi:transcriptional regulator with XRE-family HTH domain